MDRNKNLNIIYKIIFGVGLMVLGEGIFGWGLFWPVVWFLLEWPGVYWLGLILGVVWAGQTGLMLGLPSLLIVICTLVLSKVKLSLGKNNWLALVVIILTAGIVDKALGNSFSIFEVLGIVAVFGLISWWEERSRELKVN